MTGVLLRSWNEDLWLSTLSSAGGEDIHRTDHNGKTLLMLAAKRGFARAVDKLIDQGADLYAIGRGHETLLHCAVEGGLHEHIRCWLSKAHKFNLNARIEKSEYEPLDGTPLLLAAHELYVDVFQVLVEHGADLTAKDTNGFGVLHYAVMGAASYAKTTVKRECVDMFDHILQNYKELDIEQEDFHGITPLLLATSKRGVSAGNEFV